MDLVQIGFEIKANGLAEANKALESLLKNMKEVDGKANSASVSVTKELDAVGDAAEQTANKVEKANKKRANSTKTSVDSEIDAQERLLKKQKLVNDYLSQGFTRGQSGQLASFILSGTDEVTQYLDKFKKELNDTMRLTGGKSPFDSTIGPLIRINEELKKSATQMKALESGVVLTKRELDDLSLLSTQMTTNLKRQGKGHQEIKQEIELASQEYLKQSTLQKAMQANITASIKAADDEAKIAAQRVGIQKQLNAEIDKQPRITQLKKEGLSQSQANKIIKYEVAGVDTSALDNLKRQFIDLNNLSKKSKDGFSTLFTTLAKVAQEQAKIDNKANMAGPINQFRALQKETNDAYVEAARLNKEYDRLAASKAAATGAGALGKEIGYLRQINDLLESGISLQEAKYRMTLRQKGATEQEINEVIRLRKEQEKLANPASSPFRPTRTQKPVTSINTRINAAGVDLGQITNQFDKLNLSSGKATAGLSVFAGVVRGGLLLGGISGLTSLITQLATGFINYSDAMQSNMQRIALYTPAGVDLAKVTDQLVASSKENRVELATTAKLYTQILPPLQRVGVGARETLNVVDAFGKALLVGGANAREAAAATIQFGQALASGKLAGDEFRSLAEASPRILQAISDGSGIAAENLKAMSAAGKLTSGLVSAALLDQFIQLKTEALQMGQTVKGAFNEIVVDTQLFVDELNKTTGANDTIVSALRDVGEGFNNFYDGIIASLKDQDSLLNGAISLFRVILDIADSIADGVKTVVGFVFDVGDGVGLWKTALEVAKLSVIAIADVITRLGAGIVNIGANIISFVTEPFEALLRLISRGLSALGKSDLSTYFENAVTGANAFNNGLTKVINTSANMSTKAGTNVLGLGEKADKSSIRVNAYDKVIKDLNRSLDDLSAKKVKTPELTDADYVKKMTDLLVKQSGVEKDPARTKAIKDKVQALYEQTQAQSKAIDLTKGQAAEDEKAAKKKQEKLDSFSSDYDKQISDLQQINSLVQSGIAVEKAKLDVTQARQLSEDAIRGATTQQVFEMQKALKLSQQLAESAKQQEFNKKAEQDFSKRESEFTSPEPFKVGDLFGEAGKGAGALINAFQDINKQQEEYNELLADAVVYNKDVSKIEAQRSKNEIRNIGNILGATKGFFKEKSTGYKVIGAAEKAFRAFELASEIKANATKLAGYATEITAFLSMIGAKILGVEVATAATVAAVPVAVAANAAIAASAAPAAVASAAIQPGPLAFVGAAAMIALLAGLGIAVGGGSKSKGSFAPTNEGTGTVFGDKDAKSESIKKSIDLLAENSKIELPITSAMLRSLQNIEANIGGLTNLVIRGGAGENLASGVNQGFKPSLVSSGFDKLNKLSFGLIDPFGLVSGLFGKKTSIKGQGLFGADQALGDINSSGFNLKEYVDVNVKKKSFGITTSNKNSTQFGEASAELSRQFGLIFKGFYDSIKLAAKPLGENLDSVINRLDNFVVSIGKINLQGLSGEEIQAKLEAVFGAAADGIAQAAIPGLEDFQKVGEGYFETVVRVSSGIDAARYSLELLGLQAVYYTDIINKQGDIQAEIIRDSILLQESATGIKDIVSTLSGSADELVSVYKSLLDVKYSLIGIGTSAEALTAIMVRGAGGLSALSDGLSTFIEEVLTPQEGLDIKYQNVARAFNQIGVVMPTTIEAFKTLVKGLDTSTDSGQKLYGQLIALTPAFVELQNAVKDADDAITGIQDDIKKAFEELSAAILSAKDDLKRAYDVQAKVFGDTISSFDKLTTSLRKFKQELVGGASAMLSPQAKYQQSKEQFQATSALAQTGNQQAIADLEGVSREYLDASKAYYASSSGYFQDLAAVKDAVNKAEVLASNAKTTAELQLDALNLAVSKLVDIQVTQLTAGGLKNVLSTTEISIFADDIVQAIDANSDGIISQIEAQKVALIGNNSALLQNLIVAVNSGTTGTLAVKEALKGKATDSIISALISSVDRNADGQLSADEVNAAEIISQNKSVQDAVKIVAGNTLSVEEATENLRKLQSFENKAIADAIAAGFSSLVPSNSGVISAITQGTLASEKIYIGIQGLLDFSARQAAATQAEEKRQQAAIEENKRIQAEQKRVADVAALNANLQSVLGTFNTTKKAIDDAQALYSSIQANNTVSAISKTGGQASVSSGELGQSYSDFAYFNDYVKSKFNPEYAAQLDAKMAFGLGAKDIVTGALNSQLEQSYASIDALRKQIIALGGAPKFAAGGVFTNGVVSSPTMFNMGMMGEAGPEAIMPLSRGSDGSLGVRIVGGNSSAGVEDKLDESNRHSAALVRLQQEANKRIIEKLSAMEERLGGLESAARLEAAS